MDIDKEKLNDLTEQQKDSLIKNKDFSVIPLESWNTIIPIPEMKIKRCSKCGCELFLGLYIERKTLFRKTKNYCFNCANKLRFSSGKLECKEVVITGEKIGDIFIGDNKKIPSTPPNRLQIPKEDVIIKPYTKLDVISDNNYIPIKKVSDIQMYSNDTLSSIWSYIEEFIKKLKLSTFKIINLSTGKDINKNIELEIHTDKESKLFKVMKSECFDCGYNIGFKNIPSEICFECSTYDVEKTDNKYKKRAKIKWIN